MHKKSNTTINNAVPAMPSKSNQAMNKNKTMRDETKLGVLKRSSTKKVSPFYKRPRIGSKPTGSTTSMTCSKGKQNHNQSSIKVKDTSLSKSSNSELNTNEILAIAGRQKGNKKQVSNQGAENSLRTSLSKSSDNEQHTSFSSKRNHTITGMRFQRKETDNQQVHVNLAKVNLTKINKVRKSFYGF